ncbi:TetR/AcrR family transcriptional regulator [Microbacterium sp. J1-1]|uniref:TetR/AcrR family transcriptional regulator n=1 Tax=Microbacterium sp. J1-1 TaxID=2992441 RepID=UPI002114970A|nr:TetR/AcrR family transcriptional regulator [Microbacterium sp. J1-1]UUE19304.1 TetR/AcrR family transcriptional regulator [Microbacterium sp. J1-1]
MVRSPEQNAALRVATRERIETAAVRVFARRGFAASSIKDIADEAGLSAGSIYRHYASKEALFDALLEQASSGLVAASAMLSADADPVVLVREFTRVFVTDLMNGNGEAEFFLVINQGFISDTPAGTAERLARTQRPLWDAFEAVVRRGQAAGQFDEGDPVQLTAYYFAMLSGIAGMRTVIPTAMTEAGIDLVLRLLMRKDAS